MAAAIGWFFSIVFLIGSFGAIGIWGRAGVFMAALSIGSWLIIFAVLGIPGPDITHWINHPIAIGVIIMAVGTVIAL